MGRIVVASSIIWAAVILSSAFIIPEAFGKLIPIIGGGAAAHLIILGAWGKKE